MTATKTIYHVHIYREMRLYFPAIEANSAEEAARIAAGKSSDEADCAEDCNGDTIAALIDVEGDSEYEKSTVIDFEPARLQKSARELFEALEYFFNIMHDYPSSVRKGYVTLAFEKARTALTKAKGGAI